MQNFRLTDLDEFVRGDTNGAPPNPLDAGDTDDTGVINLTDVIYLLDFLFRGGTEPPPPFPTPGIDRTPDDLVP